MNECSITICVPTYNRKERLLPLINNLLGYNNPRIKIYVQNNCSTDGTGDALSEISNCNLIVRNNETPLDGRQNIYDALSRAPGDYLLLCLDKDSINIETVLYILDIIDRHTPAQGFVDLGMRTDNPPVFYDCGYDSLSVSSYKGKHPSGTFYNAVLFRECLTLPAISSLDMTFPFWIDVVNAHMSMLGECVIIKKRLVNTESEEEAMKIKSHSYNEENFYMHPKMRIKEYTIYLNDLQTIDLNTSDKYKIALDLLVRGMCSTSFVYKHAMMDDAVTTHYNIDKRKVPFSETIQYTILYTKSFIRTTNNMIPFFKKVLILVSGITLWSLKYIKSIVW